MFLLDGLLVKIINAILVGTIFSESINLRNTGPKQDEKIALNKALLTL